MPTPTTVVLFGATGDLAQRKLLPGLLHLFQSGLLNEVQVVGTSLDEHDRDSFVEFARTAIAEYGGEGPDPEGWDEFSKRLRWAPGAGGVEALRSTVAEAEAEFGTDELRRLHYLSVPPKAALAVVHMLRDAGLVERSRIIMEKPFGTDLASAQKLNGELHEVFDEEQIFRIDHFLGKEAAQNILAFRFANGLFEPIWHRNHISHVQIDVPEELGLAQRANFYESTGAYRDMVVTHLFQVLAFTAMEPPTALEPRAISEEKNKVFRSMLPIEPHDVVRGQYIGYRDIEGVAHDSETETFIALKCYVDNWRWAGVPVLPAHRQADGRGGADHLDRLPGAAALDVPAGQRRRRQRARPPHLRPRRPVEDVAVVLRQAPRTRHAAGQAVDAVRDARDRLGRCRARGLRAADLRRRSRRPDPVHLRRRHRAAVGALRAAAREPARRAALHAGVLGTQPDPPADRAAPVAPARSSAPGATRTSSGPSRHPTGPGRPGPSTSSSSLRSSPASCTRSSGSSAASSRSSLSQ